MGRLRKGKGLSADTNSCTFLERQTYFAVCAQHIRYNYMTITYAYSRFIPNTRMRIHRSRYKFNHQRQ